MFKWIFFVEIMKGRKIKFANPKVLRHEPSLKATNSFNSNTNTQTQAHSLKRYAFTSIEIVSNPQNIHVNSHTYTYTPILNPSFSLPEFSSFSCQTQANDATLKKRIPMLSRENVEWADEKTNYKRLLNDSYISNWSYEKWYPKGTYIDAKILIFFSLFIFRLKSYAFTFRAIQNSVGFLIFFLFWFSSTFLPTPLQWLHHSIPPTKKIK